MPKLRDRPRRRCSPALLALLQVGALAGGVALATPAPPPHPIIGHVSAPPGGIRANPKSQICVTEKLRCPDMAMHKPYDLRIDTDDGHTVLRVANAVLSIGNGPLEVEGRRVSRNTMVATQRIRRAGRPGVRIVKHAGRIVWQPIPGQGGYWKYGNAARFELWTTGRSPHLRRAGAKFNYCLRDLRRVLPGHRSPRFAHFGGCSQSHAARVVVLGTSVGWADIYPATYYDQFINVSGLHGCFTLWQIADPYNHLVETRESDNAASIRVRLPAPMGAAPKTC
jgi:hypothetical protein